MSQTQFLFRSISWMAEGSGKVAPIGPAGTEQPAGADATLGKSIHESYFFPTFV